MNTKRFFCFLTLALLLAGCGLLAQSEPGVPTPGEINTQIAQTVIAEITQKASVPTGSLATETPAMPSPPVITAPPEANTPVPTETSQPSPTPLPPTPTAIPVACDWALFVKDVSVPDGSTVTPLSQFTKTWRIENIGSCTWTENYALVFIDGDRMGANRVTPLQRVVSPGELVDLSVGLEAPEATGNYIGYWMLRNEKGDLFGAGYAAATALQASIRVAPPSGNYNFDLTLNYCAAAWRSGVSRLSCLRTEDTRSGFASLLDRPQLENGRTENELALWLHPDETAQGYITGEFPAYRVQPGDHFVADIGCLEGNPGCNVDFELNYQIGGRRVANLGSWAEVYDGSITHIDIDLSFLQGQDVGFILGNTNYGNAREANAFWLVPSIRSRQPTQSSTAAIQSAQLIIGRSKGIDPSLLVVSRIEATEWSDSCLGVHQPGEDCVAAYIPGYRIILEANGKQYEAHTNQDGSLIAWFELS